VFLDVKLVIVEKSGRDGVIQKIVDDSAASVFLGLTSCTSNERTTLQNALGIEILA